MQTVSGRSNVGGNSVSDLKCSLEGVLQEPEEKDKGGEI